MRRRELGRSGISFSAVGLGCWGMSGSYRPADEEEESVVKAMWSIDSMDGWGIPGMRMVRRLLLLWALMFWQGGFMFYGGVVVPVGSRILGSDLEQGWITRSVTNYLNVAGAVAMAVWGWDLLAEPGSSRGGRRLRWLLWCLLILTLGVLVWVHLRLDDLLDLERSMILDRRRFHSLHRWYLAVSTAEWLGCITFSALTIRSWRDGDALPSRRVTDSTSPENQ